MAFNFWKLENLEIKTSKFANYVCEKYKNYKIEEFFSLDVPIDWLLHEKSKNSLIMTYDPEKCCKYFFSVSNCLVLQEQSI